RTRSEVSGGNQKPWRQKGTGRARQGSTRAPHWRHGGIVFGPHPRSYRLGIPKKMRQLAKKSALNARAREGALFVVDALEYEKPQAEDAWPALLDRRAGHHREVIGGVPGPQGIRVPGADAGHQAADPRGHRGAVRGDRDGRADPGDARQTEELWPLRGPPAGV